MSRMNNTNPAAASILLVTLLAVLASSTTTVTTVEASYYTSKYYSSSSSSSGYNGGYGNHNNDNDDANNNDDYGGGNGDDDDDANGSSSSSYNFDYSDDALAYTGSYNSYMRINNCISFVTQEPKKNKNNKSGQSSSSNNNNNNGNGGGGGVDISNSLPVKNILWGVPTASFLFLHFDDGNSNGGGNNGYDYEDYGDDDDAAASSSYQGGGDSSTSSSSSSTLLIDVKDAAFAFSTTSYSNDNNNNDDGNENYYYDDAYGGGDNVGVYDYSSASCQPLDVDVSYYMFGDILDTATSSKATDSGGLNFAYAQLYVGPICRPNMWGVTVGVFADADCSMYVPVLSDVMNGYGNNNNNNNAGGEEEDGNNNNVDVEEVSASIASAVQYINQAYQGEIGCGDNANTCASILEAAADFDTCSANSFFFGDAPWSAFSSGGKKHYQISQSQLSDRDSTCAAIATAIEDTSSPAYSDYLQTLATNGGMGQYTTNPNGGSAASQAGRVWGVLFLVSVAVLMVLAVMLCKCIRIRRVRNEATGKDVLTLDVLRGGGTWFSPPSSPTSKIGAPTSPQQQQQDGGDGGGKDGLMNYITSAFAKSPRDGTVAGEDGADYQKYDDSPIGSPTSEADDSITRNRSADPTKMMKIVHQSASYDTDVDGGNVNGGDANGGGGDNVVAAASTYESEVV